MTDSGKIFSELKKKIFILSGAMGTYINSFKLSEEYFCGGKPESFQHPQLGNFDVLNLTQPEFIQKIYTDYLHSGADILKTCTFGSCTVSQRCFKTDHLCTSIILKAVRNCRSAAEKFSSQPQNKDKNIMIFGSVGPSCFSLSRYEKNADIKKFNKKKDEMIISFYDQITALCEGGADAVLMETFYDLLNVQACLRAFKEVRSDLKINIPLFVSVTLDKNGMLLSGHDLKDLIKASEDAEPLCFGINCSFGAENTAPYLRYLRSAPYLVSFHPNAGLPDSDGKYQSAENFSQTMKLYMQEGLVNIAGGCCGTDPRYIKKLSESAAECGLRKI